MSAQNVTTKKLSDLALALTVLSQSLLGLALFPTPSLAARDTTTARSASSAVQQSSTQTQLTTGVSRLSTETQAAIQAGTPIASDGKTPIRDSGKPGAEGVTATPEALSQSDQLGPTARVTQSQNVPKADESTGALRYEYSFPLPEGRKGLTPKLSLTYNSQGSDPFSLAGYDWDLTIPTITRRNLHGTDQLYNYRDFTSSEDGDLELSSTSGSVFTFFPKVSSGSFTKYVLDESTFDWTVSKADGRTFSYKNTTDSAYFDPANKAHIYRWYVSAISDSSGNQIVYTYTKSWGGQILPQTITYAGLYTVIFDIVNRSDASINYSAGFKIKITSRLQNLIVQNSRTISNLYDFLAEYTTGDNGSRTLLQKVTRRDWVDGKITKTYPATSFTYSQKPDGYLFRDANSKAAITDPNIKFQSGAVLGDVNGDSYPDMVKSFQSGYSPTQTKNDRGVYLFDPIKQSFPGQSDIKVPDEIYNFYDGATRVDGGTRALDINGDGKTDLMRTPWNWQTWTPSKEINNGNGWTQIPNSDPKYNVQYVSNPWYTLYSQDLNGDGLVDYLQDGFYNVAQPNTWTTKTSLNNGSGFTYSTSTHAEGTSNSLSETPVYTGSNRLVVMDVNNDNLPDLIQSEVSAPDCLTCNFKYTKNLYINTGHGWEKNTDFDLSVFPVYVYNTNNSTEKFDIADFNNDGLLDINTGGQQFINTGSGFKSADVFHTLVAQNIGATSNCYCQTGYFVSDFNGDTSPDFLVGNIIYYNSITEKLDKLIKVTTDKGATTDVTYKSSAQFKDSSNASLLNPSNPFSLETVASIVNTDSTSGVKHTASYTYADGYFWYDQARPLDRKFAGFGQVTQVNDSNKTITYYHQGNSSNTSQGEHADSYDKIGRPYRQEVYDLSGNLYSRTINKWDEKAWSNGSSFVKLAQTLTQDYSGGASHKDSAESFTHDDNTGNLLSTTKYGEVIGSDDGSFVDVGSDSFITTISYAKPETGSSVTAAPYVTTTTKSSGVKLAETITLYDSLAAGKVSKGLPTESRTLTKTSPADTYVTTKATYNSFGLPITSTDANGNTTTTAYDTYNLYPASVTNPESLTTSYTYDYAVGKPNSVTQANGALSKTSYDGLGRVTQTETQDPTDSKKTFVASTTVYNDTVGQLSATTTTNNSAGSATSITYFDSLGRQVETRTQSEDSSIYRVVTSTYNQQGLLATQTAPYFASTSTRGSNVPAKLSTSSFTYDALGRATQTTVTLSPLDKDALKTLTSSTSYSPWSQTDSSPSGKQKRSDFDAFGRLTSVSENYQDSNNIFTTVYSYELHAPLLTKIVDGENKVRSFTYDRRGLRLTAEDLHATSVPQTSVNTYTSVYDNAGNLTSLTKPSGDVVTYTYDKANRKLKELLNSTQVVSNVYDTCSNGKGLLCSTTQTTTGSEKAFTSSLTYAPNGAPLSVSKTGNSTTQTLSTAYNSDGSVKTETRPDTTVFTYNYYPSGPLSQVTKKLPGDSAATTVVSGLTYSPSGQQASITYGSGAVTTNLYDQGNLNRLYKKTTAITGSPTITTTPPPPQGPQVTADGLVSSAAYNKITTPLTYAPGELGSFFAANFMIDSSCGSGKQSTDLPLPTTLCGVSAEVKQGTTTMQAPLLYVGPTQVNLQLPYELKTGVFDVTFISGGKRGNTVTMGAVQAAVPGLFTRTSDGVGDTSAQNAQTYKDITKESPIKIGEFVALYGTGFGASNPAVKTGSAAAGETIATGPWLAKLSVNVNGASSSFSPTVDYVGKAPGFVGLDQINLNLTGTRNLPVGINQYDLVLCMGVTDGSKCDTANVRSNVVKLWMNVEQGKQTAVFIPLKNGIQSDLSLRGPKQTKIISVNNTIALNNALYKDSDTTPGTPRVLGATTSTITDLTYTYDADGNISKIVNTADKKPSGSFDSVTYTYDGVNRLSSVTSTCASESNGCKYTESFTYSKTGNILTDTFAGTKYTYAYEDASHPQAVTSVSSSGGTTSYSYDSNGNQKTKTDSSGATTYTWTHRNELASVTSGGKTSSFSYDPSGSRFGQSLPSGKTVTTLFPDSRYETSNGTTSVENYLNVNGSVSFASITPLVNGVQDGSSTAKFFSPDHLGSTNLSSNDKGDLISFEDYYSFGRPRVSLNGVNTSQESRQYIGKEYDETLGLSYLEARYYDSSRGSFLSLDPAALATPERFLGDPQQLNLYSYTRNNPIILSDPNGLSSISDYTSSVKSAWTWTKSGLELGAQAALYLNQQYWNGLVAQKERNEQFFAQNPWAKTTLENIAILEGGVRAQVSSGKVTGLGLEPEVFKSGSSSKYLTPEEFANLPSSGTIDPSRIRFSQDSISSKFKDPKYGNVENLTNGLKNGSIKADNIDPIRIVNNNGNIQSLDNRRLDAFQKANIEIRYQKLDKIPENEGFKFKSGTTGESVKVRGGGSW